MEDETGIANVIVTPNLYERDRPLLVTRSKFILFPVVQEACCVPEPSAISLHEYLSVLLNIYDVNQAAASVKVYAIKLQI